MLKEERLHAKHKDYERIKQIYLASFPANERWDFDELMTHLSACILYYDNDTLVGFTALFTNQTITNIVYFAIDPARRNQGYGTQILKQLCASLPGQRISVDIESPDTNHPEVAQRTRRKDFYLRNGFQMTDLSYTWQEETYVTMVYGGSISPREYESFWKPF
ncbi:MAG: GNAT family N-acetyltransferase [Erysipelotrichaceae bacterium]|nr:GNAT family N-acetyltransferase [Erysipelotrichaceae bacterium]